MLQSECFCQAIGKKVGHADITCLTRTNDCVHCFHHLVKRCGVIIHMQLIKVNVVRTKTAQGSVHRVQQMLSGVALIPGGGTHSPATLRGEDKSTSLVVQPAP